MTLNKLKEKVVGLVKKHKVTALLCGIVLLLILGNCLCSCSPGVIHADDGDNIVIDDAIYMPVAGIYEITEGTQQIIDESSDETVELAGYVFPVNQNTWVVNTLGCTSYLKIGGFVGCGGSESYSFDGWYGPIEATVSGTIIFHEDETMEMKIQINGEYTDQNYSYTINYDLKAKKKDLGEKKS